ncbi:MAG: hypothetical protein ACI85F_000073 [Bacteroidia bacterium]|jgi:hypothetical protein
MKILRLMLSTALLIGSCCWLNSCTSGCVVCTGVTADQDICKSDFQETSDYNQYIEQYEMQGGVCEEPL